MKSIRWSRNLRLPITTDTVETYRVSWTDWLEGSTISSSSISVTQGSMSAEITATASTYIDIEVQNASPGKVVMSVIVTSASGRTENRPLTFIVT